MDGLFFQYPQRGAIQEWERVLFIMNWNILFKNYLPDKTITHVGEKLKAASINRDSTL